MELQKGEKQKLNEFYSTKKTIIRTIEAFRLIEYHAIIKMNQTIKLDQVFFFNWPRRNRDV